MLETDLCQPVADYLEDRGYTVHCEVKNCDITAVKGDELIVVELKTAFNLKLLSQAVKRQRVTDSVYVAIPRPKGGKRTAAWRDMCILLRRLELGLITVVPLKESPEVEVVFHPDTFNRLKSLNNGKKAKRSIIREMETRYGNYNKGGSTRQKLMTAYKENAIFIACCLGTLGAKSPSSLKKLGTGAKTYTILSKNYYGWFEKVSTGVYSLNVSLDEIKSQYPELSEHYLGKLENIIDK